MPESTVKAAPRGQSVRNQSVRSEVAEGPSGRGQYARSHDTRARILDAALAEASESGFQKTSVAKVAARAEVAVGVLNYHFGSKGELLAELMASQVEDFLSRLAPPGEHEDFFAYERASLLTYLEFLRGHPAYLRLAEEVRVHDPALYRQGVDTHITHIAARMRAAIKRGELRAMTDDEIRAHGYFMLGAYVFLDRFIEDPAYPGDEAAATSFLDGLRGGLGHRG